MKEMILASASPRRKELLSLLDVPYRIQTADIDEQLVVHQSPKENVERLAYEKALAVAKLFPDAWVLGADTVVVLENTILGKPKNEAHAEEMLMALSGRTHEVYTGVALINLSEKVHVRTNDCTKVHMKQLSKAEIQGYIETKEPLDKAGSYAVQGKGAVFIAGIEGNYFNVVGLPIQLVYELFKQYHLIERC